MLPNIFSSLAKIPWITIKHNSLKESPGNLQPSSLRLSGFSLVEVMIVVVIIGILATVAYPSLEKYLLTSRQTEAKTNLMAIYTAQKIYQASNRKYASDLDSLGVTLTKGEEAVYHYTLTSDGTTYIATAEGNLDNDETVDTWTIDHSKKLVNTKNDTTD